MATLPPHAETLRYTPLERVTVTRPVSRLAYIARACAGRRVLDLGAMDETAWQVKRGRGTWLHEEIARTAERVYGIDSSPLVPQEGLHTAANATIRRGDISDLESLLTALPECPDIIVAGELIEHLDNPLLFLKAFAAAKRLTGKTLILSTPNATALHNVLIAIASRESTHRDHQCILSFKTLTTLCARAGFSRWQIIPYFASFAEMETRHGGLARVAIRMVQRLINLFEWLFPLLSFGYIVVIVL